MNAPSAATLTITKAMRPYSIPSPPRVAGRTAIPSAPTTGSVFQGSPAGPAPHTVLAGGPHSRRSMLDDIRVVKAGSGIELSFPPNRAPSASAWEFVRMLLIRGLV